MHIEVKQVYNKPTGPYSDGLTIYHVTVFKEYQNSETFALNALSRLLGIQIQTEETPWYQEHLVYEKKINENIHSIKCIMPCVE